MTHEPAWYTRPVFSVSDIGRALDFYCEALGFSRSWSYEENGATLLAQVERSQFEIILAGNLDRTGQGRMFISLPRVELEALQRELGDRDFPVDEIHWGYPSLRIRDPDGNELISPLESSED